MPPEACAPKKRSFNFPRFCWQFLAIILVLFALMVSLFRGLLPQLDQVRVELINYVGSEYQVEVEVGKLAAEWQAYGPALTVKNFVLPAQQNLPVTLIFNQVNVKFDFWQSIITASPQIEDVIFDGVNVALDLDHLKSLQPRESSTAMQTDWLYKLLLEQLDRFSITDARFQLLSKQHDYRPIFIKDMKWRNANGRHRGEGKLFLDEDASEVEQLALNVDLTGSGYRPESLVGQFYLAASSLDIGEWASRQPNPYDATKRLPLEGVVNLQAWAEFANRDISSVAVALQPSWLEWHLNDKPQRLTVESGGLLWRPDAQGWRLNSHDLHFSTNDQAWPELQLQANKGEAGIDASLNQLDLAMLLPLLPLIPGVEPQGLKTWQALKPMGKIKQVQAHWDKLLSQPKVNLALEQVTWQASDAILGSAPVDAELSLVDETLQFALPKQSYTLDFNGGFEAPIQLEGDSFSGEFNLAELALSLPQIHFSNQDLDIDAAVRLEFAEAAHMALLANVKIHDVANVHQYFPLNGMSSSLVSYLTQALKAGKTEDAVVLWHGAFSDYPYTNQDGLFQAGFTLSDATYEFEPSWPEVDQLNLSALFENKAMKLWINQGQLLDVNASGAYIGIPDLGEKSLLEVKLDLATTAEAANEVIQKSPLKGSVGATLDVVQISGDISGQIDLSIPLYDGESEVIKGTVNFDDTPVYITEPGIALTGVTGQLQFINDVVSGKGFTAKLYQQPLQFSFNTESMNKNYGVNVELDGQWQLANLPAELNNPLSPYYSGQADWSGDLRLIFDPIGYRVQARVESDLLGTALDLPVPFAKDAAEAKHLVAELIGDNKTASLGIKLDKQLEFWGGFDAGSGNRLAHYDILLGRLFKPGDMLRKNKGHLQIDIDQTEFSPWLPIIQGFVSQTADAEMTPDGSVTEQSSGFFPALVSIDANFNHLNLMGQPLADVHFVAEPTEHAWRFDITSQEFDGRIDFYPDWVKQGLKIVASKFHMSPEPRTEETAHYKSETIMANLPPLAVDVDDFALYGKSLGHLVLQGTPNGELYQIQTVSITTPNVELKGKGDWNMTAGKNITSFQLSLDAEKFDYLSEKLGIDPGLKDAPTAVTADISWTGAPYAFSLETLNGEVVFDLGKGHLSEVSDKGARIFSLFSLDSLLRKLSLDFSDVFGKGLYFDSFGGTLNIDNGVVKTTDTEMNAVAGNMRVRGFTDLTTESLNYDIRFVPQLASSVPTVVLLSTGGWTFGLGAFALTKVLEPVIEVISEIRFRLTGTMSEPKLEELERKSKEIEIPESALPTQDGQPNVPSPQSATDAEQSKSQSAVKATNEASSASKVESKATQATAKPVASAISEPRTIASPQAVELSAAKPIKTVFDEVTLEPATSAAQANEPETESAPAQVIELAPKRLIKDVPAQESQQLTQPRANQGASEQPKQGELDASQPIAMSKQSQRSRQHSVYRVAA
ncbi:YhdP family protein [Shewanella fidelis]|uniref:YhdP family protein n=1 Tax=Shewanella fidelis TaxID=173509 RepID=A0AAW8NKA5_9GAMM|nr:YhdP family protein [Shewanella fidelis]MDR8522169.1 YhdP family protein [Shewanella fidelis]MDW4812616.1 YhdP family protein [Shewanella fidelis]MDW4816364.1 YhdP family protein [Shewanella fidelis]MDW4820857.1 YhdP family protein [Shewanella fidelis]MDW4825080.1 YhdP family protein [Shewanella fidelis]